VRCSAGSQSVVSRGIRIDLKFCCHPFGGLDVSGLSAPVPAAKEDDDLLAALNEIDAVAWTMVDSQFGDPIADRLHVAKQADLQTRDTGVEVRPRASSLKPANQSRKALV
jgi:hypothetical protein